MGIHQEQSNMSLANWEVVDPGDAGAIRSDQSGVCNLISVTGNETRTLDDPAKIGLYLLLNLDTDGATDLVITADSDINAAGENIMTFDTVDTRILLISCTVAGALVWRAFLPQPATEIPTLS